MTNKIDRIRFKDTPKPEIPDWWKDEKQRKENLDEMGYPWCDDYFSFMHEGYYRQDISGIGSIGEFTYHTKMAPSFDEIMLDDNNEELVKDLTRKSYKSMEQHASDMMSDIMYGPREEKEVKAEIVYSHVIRPRGKSRAGDYTKTIQGSIFGERVEIEYRDKIGQFCESPGEFARMQMRNATRIYSDYLIKEAQSIISSQVKCPGYMADPVDLDCNNSKLNTSMDLKFLTQYKGGYNEKVQF